MDLEIINLHKICRACKSVEENMYSVFENKVTFDQSTKISEMLMACTSLKLQMDDGMPNLMCVTCIEQLNIAFTFKRQCEDTDSYLRDYIKKNQIKFENGIDNNTTSIFQNDNQLETTDIKNEYFEQETEIFVCKDCDKKFINLKSLNLHIKRYHTTIDSTTTSIDNNESSTKCNLCFEEFASMLLLKEHVEITHSKKVYICKICKKNIYAYSQLKRHLISHLKEKSCDEQLDENYKENTTNMITCNICNKVFTHENHLQVHVMQMHDDDSKDNLHVLDSIENYLEHYIELDDDTSAMITQTFDDFDDDECFEPNVNIVENELIKYENDIKYDFDEKLEMPVENYEIVEETTLIKRKRGRPRKGEERTKCESKNHKSIHFQCKHCDKILKTKLGYEIHIQKHCIYECGKCGEKFHDNNAIFKHLEELHSGNNETDDTDHIKSCDLCSNETFEHFDKYVKHKLNHHNIRVKMFTDKKYDCYVCGKAFTTEKYRDIHEKTHSMEKSCTCKTCGKRFSSKTNLNEHMKCHNECSKKFLCSECGQRFIRYDYLVIHMRRHRGEKPFKCKYCGKGFPRTTDLTVHERYHTGEKTHLCVICGRGFGRAYNLTVHMRTHTGEKPYQCTYCDAAFAQGNDLKAHVRRHTGERYHCDMCSEAFLMGYLLTQHKRNVHGLDVKSHIRRLKPSERVHLPPTIPQEQQTATVVVLAAHGDDSTTSNTQEFHLTYQNQVL